MNTNLIHNVLNVLIAVTSGLSAFLLATGCTSLPDGGLACGGSWIAPELAALIVTALAVTKTAINLARDGLAGLAKTQPPVR